MLTRQTLLRSAARFTGSVAMFTGLIAAMRWLRRHLLRRHRLVIVTYHRITTDPAGEELAVTRERFAAHLDYLRRHYRVVHLEDAVRALGDPAGPGEDLAVITFDDGYRDNLLLALPELQQRGLPANLFVATGFIDGAKCPWFLAARFLVRQLRARTGQDGRIAMGSSGIVELALQPALTTEEAALEVTNRLKSTERAERDAMLDELATAADTAVPQTPTIPFLSWEETRQLDLSGFRIGSHTVSHPILSRVPGSEAETEIVESRRILEHHLQRRVTTFAYPNGHPADFTDQTVEFVRRAGYQAACTCLTGFNYPGQDVLSLKRVGVGSDPTPHFAAKVEGLLMPFQHLRDWLGSGNTTGQSRPRTARHGVQGSALPSSERA